ncbi:MAG: hypothetical protein A2902_05630 [Elusimicrobia bacterium RIFCSPLOWO2_01_FULL_64_13]|nr:MAG: hypothetical protein A2636_02675 [Elusimicrobia bacterium RIFCSPHIGHO2_01_FULL_64_10]OGR94238.1 MAG: hypothetical protein A2902_05630 [Elusimicrobia bacterium RIFCSPLOWO2_01_FULL_64_13]
MRALTRYFFQGVLLLLPITITIYLLVIVFQKVDAIGQVVLAQWVPEGALRTGFGFLGTVGFIILVGTISSHWLGAALFDWVERQFARSPIVRGMYGLIRETVHSVFGKKKILSQAVLVDLPKLGYKRVGFVTQDPVTFTDGEEEKIVVYMPHSFQISGEMIVVPKASVRFLNIPPETAFKMVMSAGIAKT